VQFRTAVIVLAITDTSVRFSLPLHSLPCNYESSPYLLFTLYLSVVSTYILSVNKEAEMEQPV